MWTELKRKENLKGAGGNYLFNFNEYEIKL